MKEIFGILVLIGIGIAVAANSAGTSIELANAENMANMVLAQAENFSYKPEVKAGIDSLNVTLKSHNPDLIIWGTYDLNQKLPQPILDLPIPKPSPSPEPIPDPSPLSRPHPTSSPVGPDRDDPFARRNSP